ncbi:MAG: hypothetical protein ATN34_01145 [Epulopiscium sp. Nele67-Bin002]|nr:MAG: hypothetical protein ATN34_01145 [Epulopiscium sp. Nele67-Bin002]
MAKTEGIIPAIESAHAVALAIKLINNGFGDAEKALTAEDVLVITISGRGDKDVEMIAEYTGYEI